MQRVQRNAKNVQLIHSIEKTNQLLLEIVCRVPMILHHTQPQTTSQQFQTPLQDVFAPVNDSVLQTIHPPNVGTILSHTK